MFVSDLRRTFAAWRAQPLLPLSVLALSAVLGFADGPLVLLALPAMVFYVGFLGTQRVWYTRAWKGRGLAPGESVRLSLELFGSYFALALLVLTVSLPAYLLLFFPLGEVPARVAVALTFDVLGTFVTSALAVDRLTVPQAITAGWRLLRARFRECAPHALLPPLVLYAFADRRGWLLVFAEMAALVARGVTTSYYVRHTVRPRELHEDDAVPATAG